MLIYRYVSIISIYLILLKAIWYSIRYVSRIVSLLRYGIRQMVRSTIDSFCMTTIKNCQTWFITDQFCKWWAPQLKVGSSMPTASRTQMYFSVARSLVRNRFQCSDQTVLRLYSRVVYSLAVKTIEQYPVYLCDVYTTFQIQQGCHITSHLVISSNLEILRPI
jgi:hypothetical protein